MVAAVVSGAAVAPSFAPELWSLARRDDKVRELLVGFLNDVRGVAETIVRAWAEQHPETCATNGLSPEAWARGVAPAILGLLAGQSLMSLVSTDRTGDDAYAEAIRLLLE